MLLKIKEILNLLLLLATVDCLYTTNTSSGVQEFVYRVSAEKVSTQPPIPINKKPNKKARLVSIIRNLLSKEVKSLENSITDSGKADSNKLYRKLKRIFSKKIQN